jgi:small subunit ribosomal protein S4
MGDPKKTRKKFTTPAHMWQGTRIADELKLKREFGLKNNREIWRAKTFISNARQQARQLIGKKDEKGENLQKLLLNRLTRQGIVSKGATLSDILGLNVRDVLTRRLQSILKAKGIAKTAKEARQMIIHGQVKYNGRKHSIPGTIVPVDKEETIAYVGISRAPRAPKKKEAKGPEESPALEGGEAKPEAPAEEKKEGDAE